LQNFFDAAPGTFKGSACEHPFVSSKGSPHGRFSRAIERRNLLEAEAAARELGGLELADALSLLLVIAAKEPARFEQAAVRWHGRFEVETRGLGFAEAQILLGALASLRDPVPVLGLETIARLVRTLPRPIGRA
jgi:hypothetical protein